MDTNLLFIFVIGFVFAIELGLVIAFKVEHKIITYKRLVDYFPTSLSTMGVLGTFIGIYFGLQEFDPRNIQASIPVLLDGLKTAFSTSLWGMILSLVLSFIINLLTDIDEEKNPTEFDKLAIKISESVDKMSSAVVESMDRVRQQIDRQTQTIQNNHSAATETANQLIAIRTKLDSDLTKLLENITELKKWSQSEYIEKFDELATEVSVCRMKLSKSEEYLDNISDEETNRNKIFSDMFQTSFEEIQAKMMECNLLLDKKLDVFGTSIAKSNTEALTSVMESACTNFQTTMNSMIGQLVKENFAELNTNVRTLCQWQTTNMQMIGDLTTRCSSVIEQMGQSAKDMSNTLETSVTDISSSMKANVDGLVSELVEFSQNMTSSLSTKYTLMLDDMSRSTQTMERVAKYAETISGAEGELGNLVLALKNAMISDQSFVNVSRNLTSAIAKNADTAEKLNDVSSTLKLWMKNNADMQTKLQQLLVKLDELNHLRDFNDSFWSSAKRQLEDGIGVLRSGTIELNKQLSNIDQHFYERLSITMANLDECLSKIIESKDK